MFNGGKQGSSWKRRTATVAALAATLTGGPGLTALAATGAAGPPGTAATPVAGCAVSPGSWPMYQGGPSHSGDACSQINTSNVSTLRPAWFTSTAGAVSATPTVVAGSVYVGDSTGVFYALNQA